MNRMICVALIGAVLLSCLITTEVKAGDVGKAALVGAGVGAVVGLVYAVVKSNTRDSGKKEYTEYTEQQQKLARQSSIDKSTESSLISSDDSGEIAFCWSVRF